MGRVIMMKVGMIAIKHMHGYWWFLSVETNMQVRASAADDEVRQSTDQRDPELIHQHGGDHSSRQRYRPSQHRRYPTFEYGLV